MIEAKRFPMQGNGGMFPRTVAWDLAELAYQEYARQFGSEQTLDRLAERGGFGWAEFGMLLAGHLERHPDAFAKAAP